MKRIIIGLVLVSFAIVACSAIAANRVVVIPLESNKYQFTVTAYGALTDSATGLMWQQADDGTFRNWAAAGAYCDGLSLGGHGDWRLPTKDELKSLVVCSNGTSTPLPDFTSCGSGFTSPTIDPVFLYRTSSYWSSSVFGSDYAWYVNFTNGEAAWTNRINTSYVRCVR